MAFLIATMEKLEQDPYGNVCTQREFCSSSLSN